jgi:hypothetical protein
METHNFCNLKEAQTFIRNYESENSVKYVKMNTKSHFTKELQGMQRSLQKNSINKIKYIKN